jgi:hypothetical protein
MLYELQPTTWLMTAISATKSVVDRREEKRIHHDDSKQAKGKGAYSFDALDSGFRNFSSQSVRPPTDAKQNSLDKEDFNFAGFKRGLLHLNWRLAIIFNGSP